MVTLILLLFSFTAMAQEGYPPGAIKISHEKEKGAFIRNTTCFTATVFVNGKSHLIKANSEINLDRETWTSWHWHPGSIGPMNEKTMPSPLKEKFVPDFGPGFGQTHVGEFHYSYDFSVPEGSQVFAMEEGTVVRIVQHYRIAHLDKSRINEVNKVEILHDDGSFSSYVHLKPQSVTVRLCERVARGKLLGLSGHNGYSNGPHLHVDLIRPVEEGRFKTIPMKFLSK